jgi:hypothetical protein
VVISFVTTHSAAVQSHSPLLAQAHQIPRSAAPIQFLRYRLYLAHPVTTYYTRPTAQPSKISTRSTPQPIRVLYTPPSFEMKYAHAIILTMVLIVTFCIFFGWCLYKSFRRIVDVEHHELQRRKGLEASAVV